MTDERTYTVEEANTLLPWLRERLGECAVASSELEERQQAVREAQRRARSNGHRDAGRDISSAELQAVEQMRRIRRVVDAVNEKDIQIRDVSSGLIDFPGARDGHRVWLCWRMDEPEVGFWHELDTGFGSRQPL